MLFVNWDDVLGLLSDSDIGVVPCFFVGGGADVIRAVLCLQFISGCNCCRPFF